MLLFNKLKLPYDRSFGKEKPTLTPVQPTAQSRPPLVILDTSNESSPQVDMSLDSLTPELLGRTGLLVVAQQDRIAKYATISRAWQHTIE